MEKPLYDRDYYENGKATGKSNYEDYSWERLGSYFRATAQHIAEKFSPKSVIDIGCAKGFLVKGFQDLGVKAKGIDISAYAIENAHPAVKDAVRLGNIVSIPYKTAEFDVVTCLDVMEHIPEKDVARSLKEMLRVAKEYVVIRVVTENLEDDKDATHETIRDRKWWEKQIESVGGALESIDKYLSENVWWFNVPEFLIIIKKTD